MRIAVAAPAKVNLRLRVGALEDSGFHAIDTYYCLLHLADSLVVRPGSGAAPILDVRHARPLTEAPQLGPDRENLAVRAATAFMQRAGLDRGPEIRLVKRIPVGAGLGGGSSDAAAVLRAMARLHPGTLSSGDLMELGSALGSDVPFFVRGAPLAHGTGRGERLASLTPLAARPVVLAVPDFPVATADAYRWLDEARATPPSVAAKPRYGTELDWGTLAEEAVNDFEGPVFRRHPRLAELRDRLRSLGARPALLAGSGSTVFGVFEETARARQAAEGLRSAPSTRVLMTRTRTR